MTNLKAVGGRLGEIVDLAKGGADNKAISEKLGLMLSTVKTYMHTARTRGLLPRTERSKAMQGNKTVKTAALRSNGAGIAKRLGLATSGKIEVLLNGIHSDGRIAILVVAPTSEVGAVVEHLTTKYAPKHA